MGENKRPIVIFRSENDIRDLVAIMVRIKRETGREVCAFFSNRLVSTEAGNEEEIVQKYLASVTEGTKKEECFPTAEYLYMNSQGLDVRKIAQRLIEAKEADDNHDDKFTEYGGAVLDTFGGKTVEEMVAAYEESKKYSSKEYYNSILTTEDKRQDVIRRESMQRRQWIYTVKEELADGTKLSWEYKGKKVEFGIENGTLVRRITYTEKTTLPDGTEVKPGTMIETKGEMAITQLLEPENMEMLFDTEKMRWTYSNSETEPETAAAVTGLIEKIEEEIQAKAAPRIDRRLTWSVSMRNAIADVQEERFKHTDVIRLEEQPVVEELAYPEEKEQEADKPDNLTGAGVKEVLPIAEKTMWRKFLDFISGLGKMVQGLFKRNKDNQR